MASLHGQSLNFSPARSSSSPHTWINPDVDSSYLEDLIKEKHNFALLAPILPICSRLLNQEIMRVCGRLANQGIIIDFEMLQSGSPSHLDHWNGTRRSPLQNERLGGSQGFPIDNWNAAPRSPSSFLTKRVLRINIPVDSFPNFNFVGRLLGPRGNSLKRVEASTGCRVFIRGRGSIKDPFKEECLRGRGGYEHLNEPLHILIEAELPPSIIDARLRQAHDIIQDLLKPVEESRDLYKRQQLRELAMLNSKRAKTAW